MSYKMPYGKYKGLALEQIPTTYLEWILKSMKESAASIEDELEAREQQESATLSMARRLIEAGYRQLAKQMHPDAGGDTAAMQELNGTVERLRRTVG